MNSLEEIRAWINPIPDAYKYLASTFDVEINHTLRRIIRVAGAVQVLGLILVILNHRPALYSPVIVVLDVLLLLLSASLIYFSYRPFYRLSLYHLVFAIELLILSLAGIVAWLTETWLITLFFYLFVVVVGTLFSWLPIWNVRLQGAIAILMGGVYGGILLQSKESFVVHWVVVVIIAAMMMSLYLHVIFTEQRWRSFLSRHQNFLLNAELQTTNMQLEQLNNRLQNELNLAHDIQQSLLPSPFPEWPGFDIVCYNKPARELGGDFYSYRSFNAGRFGLAVGDVSGKGVSAALLMAATLSLFDSTLITSRQPGDLLIQLDEAITSYTKSHQQNCALCYIDIEQQASTSAFLKIANAASIPPYILSADGQLQSVPVGGFPLGQEMAVQFGYDTVSVSLTPGNFVILTSDGVAEALNPDNEMFGFERLEKTLMTTSSTTAQSVLEDILADLTAFTQGHELHDDITIIVFQLAQ